MTQLSKARWQRLGFIVLSAVVVGILSALSSEELKNALYGVIGDKNVAMLLLAVVYNILVEVKNSITIKKSQLGSGGVPVNPVILL